jgi:hypothetical protein
MRLFVAAITYAVSVVLVALAAMIVLMAAGNSGHASWLEAHWLGANTILAVGWLAVIVVPILAAVAVWKRLGKHTQRKSAG